MTAFIVVQYSHVVLDFVLSHLHRSCTRCIDCRSHLLHNLYLEVFTPVSNYTAWRQMHNNVNNLAKVEVLTC